MNIKIKRLLTTSVVGSVLLLFLAVPVFAILNSSSFLPQAQDFINKNCDKKVVNDEKSVLCYLFYKTGEIDSRVNTLEQRGITGWERLNAMTDNDTTYRKRVTVSCTGNKKVIGGGVNISNGDDRRTFISQSFPDTDHSWTAGAEETTIDPARSISGNPWTLEAFVMCADVN